jgi:adenylate cyclase
MDVTDFERLGVYDPNAPDADDQLRLLEYLVALGATEDELVEAQRAKSGGGLALDLILRGPGARISFEDAVARTGSDPEEAARAYRALGFPDPRLSDTLVSEEMVGALNLVGTGAREFLGYEASVALARVIGSTTYRLAQAIVDSFRIRFELPQLKAGVPYSEVVKQYGELTRQLMPPFMAAIDAILRRHLVGIARGTWSFDEEGATARRDLLVGFVDMVGYSSLSRAISPGRLAELVVRFENVVGEIVSHRSGRVVKLIGDGAMFVCEDTRTGCELALALIGYFDSDADLPPVHVGIAAGPLVTVHGDYFGDAVNVAARLLALAPSSIALTTKAVAETTGDSLAFEPLAGLSLENGDAVYRVMRL